MDLQKLEIGFNGNRIVDVNLTSEGKVKLVPNTKIQMSYSVKWKKSDVKFEDRFDKYLDPSFFQHRIHWFSIFNSHDGYLLGGLSFNDLNENSKKRLCPVQ